MHASRIDKDLVREAAPIDVVLGRWVELKGRGSVRKAMCPFCGHHKPKFHVDLRKQRWQCWVCGEHGDVFDFVAKVTSKGGGDFDAVVREVASIVGLLKADGSVLKGSPLIDPAAVQRAREKAEREEKREAEIKARNEAAAIGIVRRAREGDRSELGHARVRGYLAARHIPLDRLPNGAVPSALRFWGACPVMTARDRDPRYPAMVAAVSELDPETRKLRTTGVHRTFLDPYGRDAKHPVLDSEGKAKQMLGSCRGRAVYLSRSFPRGVLLIAEGIETTLACMASTGLGGLAALSAGGIESWRFNPSLFAPGPQATLGLVVVCADRNTTVLGESARYELARKLERVMGGPEAMTPEFRARILDVASMPVGERAAWCLALRLGAACPWLTVAVRMPPERTHKGKAVTDWRDELEAVGPGETAREILEGLDPEAAHDRARTWTGGAGFVSAWDEEPKRLASTRSASATRPGASETPAGASSAGRGEAGRAEDAGADGPPGDGGDGPPVSIHVGSGGPGDDGRPRDDRPDPAWSEGLCEIVPGYARPCITANPRLRARLFLLERCWMPGSRRWRLLRWGGQWFWFDRGRAGALGAGALGGGWRAIEEDAELYGLVQEWLMGFNHKRELERGVDVKPVRVQACDVAEVCKSLASMVSVTDTEAPCWLTPMLGPDGRPPWAMDGVGCGWDGVRDTAAAAGTVGARGGHGERSAAKDWIVFADCRLDMVALREGNVRHEPNTPDLFTFAARPYPLPAAELDRMLASPPHEQIDVLEEIAPTFSRFIDSITRDDEDRPVADRDARIEALQKMLGDTISSDRRLEKIYVVSGPKRAGKGTLINVIEAVCGKASVASPNFTTLADRFGPVTLVGKTVAVMPDVHLGRYTDGTQVVEMLKSISGGDPISIRDMYRTAESNVRIGVRFWLFCNEIPDLRDSSEALAGRIVPWPLTRSFFGAEDLTLKDEIKREGAAICVWALAGYRRLWSMARPSIELSDTAKMVQEEIYDNTSPLRGFVAEVCVNEAKASVEFGVLYKAYETWCEQQGVPAAGRNKLRTRLAAQLGRSLDLRQVNGRRWVYGIGVKADQPGLDDGTWYADGPGMG